MDIAVTNSVRRVLKEHKPIPQEGVPYINGDNPIHCACGEGQQRHWGDGMPYTAWLDHVQVQLLDTDVAER